MAGFSLYVHIPYCFHRCPYCDFNTYAVAKVPEIEYTAAVLAELEYWAAQSEWRGRQVDTIFFGGGTPSLFSAASLRKILVAISRTFPINDQAEISIEANPGTVTVDSLAGYREAGINRISFGCQSFDTETLKQLGRMHTAEQSTSAIEYARSAGFNNINIDIIYATPAQTLPMLQRDLREALSLEPSHVSAYGLTIEKGTPFYSRYKSGALALPKEETIVEMMREIPKLLAVSNMPRYEISNYARSGREAKHNLAYWNGHDYLGLGAGAHSFHATPERPLTSARRWSNYATPEKYIKQAGAQGLCESWRDKLDREDLIFEFFFLGLRKTGGVSADEFTAKFGFDMNELYHTPIEIMLDRKLLKREGVCLSLTDEGFLLADSVIENFIESGTSTKRKRLAKTPVQTVPEMFQEQPESKAANQ